MVRVTSRVHNRVTAGFHVLYLEIPEEPYAGKHTQTAVGRKEWSGIWDFFFSLEKRKNGLQRWSLFGWNLKSQGCQSSSLKCHLCDQSSWENHPQEVGLVCSGNPQPHQLLPCNPESSFWFKTLKFAQGVLPLPCGPQWKGIIIKGDCSQVYESPLDWEGRKCK